MKYTIESYINIAKAIIKGRRIEHNVYHHLSLTGDEDVFKLMAGADLIRDAFFKRDVHLCAIL